MHIQLRAQTSAKNVNTIEVLGTSRHRRTNSEYILTKYVAFKRLTQGPSISQSHKSTVSQPARNMAPARSKPPKTRGLGFSPTELGCLLDCIDEHLPIGGGEWELVERDPVLHYPDMGRTKETLKRKFVSLYQKRTPTGDPKYPSEVRRAKQLYEEIKKKRIYQMGAILKNRMERVGRLTMTMTTTISTMMLNKEKEETMMMPNNLLLLLNNLPPKKKQKTFVQSSEKPLNRIRGTRSHKRKRPVWMTTTSPSKI